MTLLAALAGTWALQEAEARSHRVEQRAAVFEKVSTLSGRIQEIFNARASLAHGLAAVVQARRGVVDDAEFDLFAQHLRANFSDIRSLQLAPGGVVRFVYPVDGNRQALGHDIRRDPARSAAVERAIRERIFVVAGPHDLVQGGTAIIARLPIYLGGEEFWGFATVVLDLEPLLKAGGIMDGAHRLRIAIRGRDGLGAAGDVFFGDPALYRDKPVTMDINVPGGAWQLAATPEGGWSHWPPSSMLIVVGGLVLGLTATLFVHHLLAEPARLRAVVARVTAGLEESRRRAEAATYEAQQANQAKTRFLAAASHDLRQPLQSLFLFAAALGQQVEGDKARGALVMLERGLETLKALLDSLLDVSRLDAGVIRPEITTFPLDRLLSEIRDAYTPVAESRGLALAVSPCGAVWVRSDRNLLGCLVRNFVENALRYTHRGGIDVACDRLDGCVRVVVHDTGIGIPAEHLGRIFEEFHQVGNVERDRSQGLGLGLAIVRRISRLLDHPVAVRSEPGEGSAFSVDIPVVPVCEQPAPAPGAADSADDPAGNGRFVVLVEDDAIVLLGLQAMFREWGYDVLLAGSADQAMEKLAAAGRTPDLVVADYRLRDGRVGTEAILRIRARYGAGIPGIILTGETGSECQKDAVAHHLTLTHKPATERQLRGVVTAAIGV